MFGGLFEKSTFLDPDVEDWVFDTWAWMMTEFGGLAQLRWTKLVLPTSEFFPRTTAQGHDLAAYLFKQTAALMNMADWPCELVSADASPTTDEDVDSAEELGVTDDAEDAGVSPDDEAETYDQPESYVIVYDPNLLQNPMALTAQLAQALARYRMTRANKVGPGGVELENLTAELVAAFLGFGVFGANSACDYHASQHMRGRRSSTAVVSTYLTEETWGLVVTLFCALKDIEPPFDRLRGPIAEITNDATQYLKRHIDKLDALKAIR